MRNHYLNKVQNITEEIYSANINHFDDLRNICNEEQSIYLNEFIHTLINREKHPHPKKNGTQGRRLH